MVIIATDIETCPKRNKAVRMNLNLNRWTNLKLNFSSLFLAWMGTNNSSLPLPLRFCSQLSSPPLSLAAGSDSGCYHAEAKTETSGEGPDQT